MTLSTDRPRIKYEIEKLVFKMSESDLVDFGARRALGRKGCLGNWAKDLTPSIVMLQGASPLLSLPNGPQRNSAPRRPRPRRRRGLVEATPRARLRRGT